MSISGNKIRILHITPWYPAAGDASNGAFIAQHIRALEPFCEQVILHVDVAMPGQKLTSSEDQNVLHLGKKVPLTSWRLVEWVFYRQLKKKLITMNAREHFTHVNFHIAYPAMMYFDRLEKFLPRKKIITEHWSAYHFNFYTKKKPQRLARIFHHGIPLIVVSRSLATDIHAFAGRKLNAHIIPNIVDSSVYHFRNEKPGNTFEMFALWKFPKEPLKVLEAIKELRDEGKLIQLRIGGYGPYWPAIETYVKENRLQDRVRLYGSDTQVFANGLSTARAFIMPSQYETFSVVTAEAFCSGCPVIADHVGALPELLDDTNGVLRKPETPWKEVLQSFDDRRYNRKEISRHAIEKFSPEVVGKKYSEVLSQIE